MPCYTWPEIEALALIGLPHRSAMRHNPDLAFENKLIVRNNGSFAEVDALPVGYVGRQDREDRVYIVHLDDRGVGFYHGKQGEVLRSTRTFDNVAVQFGHTGPDLHLC
ncbi:hypothetical protein B5807_06794 [Epicoccum nigrum]|uniref:Uncharacterized protein n=1 Tax=Epicoccum nigrum TaxID=105696 RepID=A0A1Y2LYV0_EPING|nr:hypothetical protein B5807_06794 [Epicoccum nigrum]